MKMYILFSAILGVAFASYSPKCLDQTPIASANEDMCIAVKPWYLYASSEPCDDCCITRSLVKIRPGVVLTIEKTMMGNETSPVIKEFVINKHESKVSYSRTCGQIEYLILDTDCRSYGILYFPAIKKLSVYTSEPTQASTFLSSLDRVTKCNMKMYKYNPSKKCA